MPRARLRWAGMFIALIALFWIASAQVVALTPDHSDDHASHCCARCHIGHTVVVPEPDVSHAGGTSWPVQGTVTPPDFDPVVIPVTGPDLSRAPPVSLTATALV